MSLQRGNHVLRIGHEHLSRIRRYMLSGLRLYLSYPIIQFVSRRGVLASSNRLFCLVEFSEQAVR